MAANRASYSNLEVVPPDPAHQPAGLEVYQHDHRQDPQPVTAEQERSPLPIYAPPEYTTEKIANPGAAGPVPPYPESEAARPEPRVTICGLRPKIFWSLMVLLAIVIVVAIAGGVGGYYGSKSRHSGGSSLNDSSTSNANIASLHWTDVDGVDQYRVYVRLPAADYITESAWNTTSRAWTVTNVTSSSQSIGEITPVAAVAGYPHVNINNTLVKNVYFYMSDDSLTAKENPYQNATSTWGDDNFARLYSSSSGADIFAYWYQNFDTDLQILSVFFQELSANSLTHAKYVENATDDEPWQSSQMSIDMQHGSSIAAAPVGSRRDLRLYIGNWDGTMDQVAYNTETDVKGDPTTTNYDLSPHTPICVSTQDNRAYYSAATLPECAQTNTGAFITHLILFATADRSSLSLVSWNCSEGFSDQQYKIEGLLQDGRTYLDVATTSASNLTFTDQRVYVLYEDSSGLAVDEWRIPDSGSPLNATELESNWTLVGTVPFS